MTMRCLLVLSALVAMASAIGEAGRYDPGRYDAGRLVPDNAGRYNGDRGDRGSSGGQYDPQTLAPAPVLIPTAAPIPVAALKAAPKEHPTNKYQYKYGLADVEKELLLTLNLEDSDDLNKAYFEYTNSRGQIYRTDHISDDAHNDHVL